MGTCTSLTPARPRRWHLLWDAGFLGRELRCSQSERQDVLPSSPAEREAAGPSAETVKCLQEMHKGQERWVLSVHTCFQKLSYTHVHTRAQTQMHARQCPPGVRCGLSSMHGDTNHVTSIPRASTLRWHPPSPSLYCVLPCPSWPRASLTNAPSGLVCRSHREAWLVAMLVGRSPSSVVWALQSVRHTLWLHLGHLAEQGSVHLLFAGKGSVHLLFAGQGSRYLLVCRAGVCAPTVCRAGVHAPAGLQGKGLCTYCLQGRGLCISGNITPSPTLASFCGSTLHPDPWAATFTCLEREALASPDFVSRRIQEHSSGIFRGASESEHTGRPSGISSVRSCAKPQVLMRVCSGGLGVSRRKTQVTWGSTLLH